MGPWKYVWRQTPSIKLKWLPEGLLSVCNSDVSPRQRSFCEWIFSRNLQNPLICCKTLSHWTTAQEPQTSYPPHTPEDGLTNDAPTITHKHTIHLPPANHRGSPSPKHWSPPQAVSSTMNPPNTHLLKLRLTKLASVRRRSGNVFQRNISGRSVALWAVTIIQTSRRRSE